MLKTKREKIYLGLIALFAFAFFCVLIIGLSGRHSKNSIPAPVSVSENTPEVVIKEVEKFVEIEKVITSEILQDGLNDMGVLITQEYCFTDVISFSSVKKFLKTDIELGFTESSYLATYDGVVTAGIDFSGIAVEKDEGKAKITVHLPEAEIQNIDIDPNSFQLYSEKSGFGNPLSVEDFNNSLVELEKTAKNKAIERDLLVQADENAKAVITRFVGSLVDLSAYSLEFVIG